MAASKKKNTSSSSAASRKGKNASPSPSPRSMGVELIGLAVICAAVVSFIVLVTTTDPTNAVRSLLEGLAGKLSIVLPFIILWAGLLTTFAGSKKHDVGRILMMAGCVLTVFSMVHVFYAGGILSRLVLRGGWLNFIEQSFFERAGGGAIGALLAYPLYMLVGKWGAFIILLFLLISLVVLLKQISLRRLGEMAQEYIQTNYADFRQNQSVRTAERSARRQAAEEERRSRSVRQTIPSSSKRGASWDNVTFDSSASSVEQIDPISQPRTAASENGTEPLPRQGAKLEVPEYLKEKRRKKKPAFGEAAPAQAEQPLETAAPFRRKSSRLVADVPPMEEPVDIPAEEPFVEDIPTAAESEETVYEEWAAESFESDMPAYAGEEAEEIVDIPTGTESDTLSDEDMMADLLGQQFDGYSIPDEDSDASDEENEPAAADPFVFPPFDPDEPVQRERRRKVLGEPIRPVEKEPVRTYAPDDYVPNEDYDPNPSFKPGMRLDRTPLTVPAAHKDAIPDETAPEYNYPPVDLLSLPKARKEADREAKDEEKASRLESTLHDFGINAKLTGIAHGPAVTRFELKPAPGVKVNRITALADDIALSLAALSVRIEAPIPGKAAVGVEIPNETVESVPLREVLESAEARKHPSRLAVAMGKDNSGKCVVGDIAKMPHVLIAGATGSGKSVCINCIICSILYRATPEEVRLIMIDPKMVELSAYNGIPHLLVPVVTDPKKASGALQWAVAEMTERFRKFAERGVREIKGYNLSCGPDEKPMPQIVIIIDELADLMMVSPGEVEDSICRLAQLARAAGIHLVIATQRPSVNVITGVIKANIPARIAFTVASFVDSRTILDVGGAEKLLGRGDMLFAPSGSNKMQRVQGAWVSDDEVHAIVEYIKARHDVEYNEDVIERMNKADEAPAEAETDDPADECDELLQQAIEIAVEAGQASISMLQRRLRIGYARAGRLIDEMAARGIVSQSEGAKPRSVLITREQYNTMFRNNPDE